VGGGVLLAEVQQTSDATFRLYDWDRRDSLGRSRSLHVEEGLACIDWTRGPIYPVWANGYPVDQETGEPSGPCRQRLVDCSWFTLNYVRQQLPFCCGGSGQLEVLLVLHEGGTLVTKAGAQTLTVGDTLLLPAAMPAAWCQPNGSIGLLLVKLPDSSAFAGSESAEQSTGAAKARRGDESCGSWRQPFLVSW
jgi:mannose-6-phosphate isomerase